jgi:Ca2+/Na+ antiporter
VLGACSLLVLLSPAGVFFQLSFLTVISLLMILLMNRGLKLTRGEGVVLLAIYIGYLWYSFSISGPSF